MKYEGTRYVWGGENRLGIDCSGLVRKGLINANIRLGLQTLNPRLVRSALDLWWHDCSAKALRDEYRNYTARLSQAQNINDIPPDLVLPGDLAITSDGSHVLAYLGDKTWIEADPNEMKVIAVEIPSDNMWFKTPVYLVRWSQLLEDAGRSRSNML
jgi:cell wall-associated NlpC family hydrolase